MSDTHTPGTGKGEEKGLMNQEGRHDKGKSHAGRPAGERTARDATGINPRKEEPIDPRMPNMPPA
ncbi:MAG TPA: hypothetical protein VMM84_08275 [Pyrinomonadaceae bacterium]|nr:hypothetical protein [Pyrinomonadaceae bacterium]